MKYLLILFVPLILLSACNNEDVDHTVSHEEYKQREMKQQLNQTDLPSNIIVIETIKIEDMADGESEVIIEFQQKKNHSSRSSFTEENPVMHHFINNIQELNQYRKMNLKLLNNDGEVIFNEDISKDGSFE